MAIVRRGRYGETAVAEYKSDKIVQRYTQPWIIELEDEDPDPITAAEVLALPGLPRPQFSTYSPRDGITIPFAVCKTVTPKPDPKSRRLWHANATFELSGTEQQDPQDDTLDPINLAPRVEPFTSTIELPMLKDFDDKTITDPFDQLYDSPVMAQIALPGIRVTKYVTSFDENTLAGWKFTTNDDDWRGQPKDTWCIQEVTGQEVQFGNFTVGQLQFDISANSLELEIDGEATRVGWMETRALLSSVYKADDGTIQEFRIDGTAPVKKWIKPDGTKSTADPPEQFVAYRNRHRKDFSLILES